MKIKRKDLINIARQINDEIFSGSLDIENLVIRIKRTDTQNVRAWYYRDERFDSPTIVIIESEHNSMKQVFATIAHELIHHWQDEIAECFKLSHNGQTFRYWKYRICKLYGIPFTKYF